MHWAIKAGRLSMTILRTKRAMLYPSSSGNSNLPCRFLRNSSIAFLSIAIGSPEPVIAWISIGI